MKLGIWQKRMRSEKESMAMTKTGILPWILTKSLDSIDIKRLVWYNDRERGYRCKAGHDSTRRKSGKEPQSIKAAGPGGRRRAVIRVL